MNLQEIQQASLEILKEFHSFCVANDIKYSLAYGTLIGAIRHKGFIPWDDDVDVMMGRDDFEKFFALYPKHGRFTAISPKDCYMAIGRFCDEQETLAKSDVPWKKGKAGLWIDVFPVDCVPDTQEEFEKLHARCRSLYYQGVRRRKLKLSFVKMRVKHKLQYIIQKLTFATKLETILERHRQTLAEIKYGSTNHCCQLAIPDNGTKDYLPLQSMQEYIEVDFAGEKMMSIKDYDTYLRNIYGDYMQLPPEEKRVPLQHYIKFYWKNK